MKVLYALLFLAIICLALANIHSIEVIVGKDINNPAEVAAQEIPEIAAEKRGACNAACSCGWGNCVAAPGYKGSSCCSENYSWHCC